MHARQEHARNKKTWSVHMTQEIKRRPGIITVTGVLAIVFSSIGILFLLITLGIYCYGGSEFIVKSYKIYFNSDTMKTYDSLAAIASKYYVLYILILIFGICIRITELTGGILFISSKQIGRTLLGVFALSEFIDLTASLIWSFSYMKNTISILEGAQASALLNSHMLQIIPIIKYSTYAGMAVGCIGLSWPILVLIFITRKSVKDYFKPSL
jgi:hypothetical protein